MKAILKLSQLSVTSFRTDDGRLAARWLMGGHLSSRLPRACTPPTDETDPIKTGVGHTSHPDPIAGASGNDTNGD